jgi:hypothetical protein
MHQQNGRWGRCYLRLMERRSRPSRPQELYRSNVHFADAAETVEVIFATMQTCFNFNDRKLSIEGGSMDSRAYSVANTDSPEHERLL